MPVLADVPANPSGLDIIRFVDRIAASPTVRLDLNDGTTWGVNYNGTDLSPPPMKQSWSNTLLTDGERLNASAYANRTLVLNMDLMTSSQDTAGLELQKLWRELNRATNFLMWQPNGASKPVFFRTIRSSNTRVTEYPSGTVRSVEVSIDAEPFAYGLQETLSAVTVRNDPDPFFTNPMYFDVPTPKGDVETPLYLKVVGNQVVSNNSATRRLSAIGVRRRGDPSNAPFALQAEEMFFLTSGMYADMGTGESQYRGALNANIGFDVNINNWTATGGTAVRDTAITQGGSAGSLRLTPDGVSALAYVESEKVNVTPGRYVAAFAQVRNAVARNIDVGMNWFDAGGSYIVTTSNATAVTAGVFTFARTWAKAPPNAAKASMTVSMPGTPAATNVMHVDNAQIGLASSVAVDMQGYTDWTRTVWTGAPSDAFPQTPSVDARGTYRVFLRYRYMANGTNWNIDARLRWGRSPDRMITNPAVTLPHYDQMWRYSDLGLVQIPGGYDPVHDGVSGIETVTKGVYAELEVMDGDGVFHDLKLDHFLFVPADDRLLLIRWPSHVDTRPANVILDSAAGQVYATSSTGEIETLTGSELGGGTPMITPGVANRVFWVLDVGREVVAGFEATLTNTMNVTPYYWPRYLSVRPPS